MMETSQRINGEKSQMKRYKLSIPIQIEIVIPKMT